MKLSKLLSIVFFFLIFSNASFGQASLPVSRTAWNTTPTGWTDSGISLRSTSFACSGNNAGTFDTNGDQVILFINSAPSQLVFKLKKASMSGVTYLLVEESPDGSTYSTIGNYGTDASSTAITDCADITLALSSTTRYIRWTYTKGTGNCDMDDVNVTAPAGITTANNGNWNVGSTWTGGVVPTSAQNAIINHAVTMDVAVTRDLGTTTTINAAGSLATGAFTYTNSGTTNVNGTFKLDTGGWATGNNFNYGGTSTLVFNSTSNYAVNNTDKFWPAGAPPYNVTVLQGGFTMNATMARSIAGTLTLGNGNVVITAPSSLTINGTCLIVNGGFFNQSPIYGASSLLKYNTTGTYGRGFEWQAAGVGTIGVTPGYPNNVQVSNATTLDYINGAASGAVGVKAMAGSLTIDSGCSIAMNYGGVSAGGLLIVAGDVTNAGTLTLGAASGDDLRLGGNFSNTGTFNGNNRAVFFTKIGTQTVTSSSALTIPYVVTTGSGTTVQLLSNLTISAPLAGNVISFGNAADVIDINGRTLTLGTAAVANTITGSGSFKGSTTSNLSLLGTGSIGTVKFVTDLNLATFSVNRSAAAVACVLGSALTINTSLVLTNGLVDLASNTMTLASTCSNTFTASANSYVIADVTAGGVLRKAITATATVYNFPIGDRVASADGTQYSPATVNFTAGTFTSAFLGVAVEDSKHPNMDATGNFISRYWTTTTTGTFTSPTYTFGASYLAVDINGTETLSKSNQWNGSIWTNGGAPIGGNSLSIGGCTNLTAPNHFSAGDRDKEINIVQGATNYLTGSTYNFGNVVIGFPVDIVFTIQNLGQQTLTLGSGGNAPSMTGNPPYSLFATYLPLTTILGMTSTTPNTRTFTIRFSPTATGTFTGSVTIISDDADEGAGYVINFTGIGQSPAPDIRLKGFTGGTSTITNGSASTSGINNTAFGSINLGSNATKDFEIQNHSSATAVLNLTGAPIVTVGGTNPGDFVVTTVPSSTSISPGNSTTFIITFTPQYVGYRSAIVSIANNDSTKNPFTYLVDGTGVCLATANTITPTSGPVGTEVTINATSGVLTGATVSLNAVGLSFTTVSTTQITTIIPTGVTSGSLITTSSQGCQASNTFTVINNVANTCKGGTNASNLFISEVTDATYGGLTYVEIFNGTGASVNLSNYSLQFFQDGNATPYGTATLTGTLANNATHVFRTTPTASVCGVYGGNGSLANQTTPGINGINFSDGGTPPNTAIEHDYIALFNNATKIDSWGEYMNQSWAASLGIGDRGVDFRRKNNVTVPKTTYSHSDWEIIDWIGSGSSSCDTNDYSDVGVYNFIAGNPPSVTLQPTYTPTCKSTTLTVGGSEGFVDAIGLTYQWYAVAPNTATWTALTNSGLYSGVTTNTLSISDVSTLTGYQFYCQIRENTVTCYTATNAVMILPGQTTTWQASNTWSNGLPSQDKAVIIDHTYDTANGFSPSFEACSVTVNNGKSLTVRSGNYVVIKNELTVISGGTATFENNSSLVQVNNVVNSGNITYKRIAQQRRLDYVYWSSPVDNYNLSALPSNGYKYTWNTTLNNANGTQGNWQSYSGLMASGKGYIVSGPSTFNNTANQDLEVPFLGVPRNGNVSVTINRGSNTGPNYTLPSGALVTNLDDNWNLLGNPYPSAISCRNFLTANSSVLTGALYIWTHGTLPSTSTANPFYDNFYANYNPNTDYLPFNLTGNLANPNPDYYIGAGQGFFVVMQDGATGSGTVNFTNALRDKTYGNVTGTNFYRLSSNYVNETVSAPEQNRIWLDIVKDNDAAIRTMFGYVDGATMDNDNLYDAPSKKDGYLKLYSLVGYDRLIIQGRALPFNEFDEVPLGMDIQSNGSYKIALAFVDGLFENEAQKIFLEDTYLNIIHDLKQTPYLFTTESGTYTNRFKIRYTTNSLDNQDIETINSNVIVSSNNDMVTVKSTQEEIKSVKIYDLLGRELIKNEKVNGLQFSTYLNNVSTQTLIVKIQMGNNFTVSKKIIVN
ncbi:choice-of-anchor D domain-containing protein [Flavobacterium capsici]|uniref:Choice-of-anchor D domain-containing protein n=1 Tax=Flavobacterium capsici TaxID=3075618 RepID=A0AA96J7D0_9FLAO|nr:MULTISPECIES: choice-of-anchor D domain-containing protein [unclassified Flavobacterium]WNM19807.1 choice-of-anchor D domain-containing protein [Flavobacterium sp. PMR2A8]WNM21196.1 choice-of-anchor D domain-containing protein [Flavobacterium sp. PMTSA4]